jgi:hypothetical protein
MLCCRYDNGVSGGVSGMDHFLAKFYPGEQAAPAGNRVFGDCAQKVDNTCCWIMLGIAGDHRQQGC